MRHHCRMVAATSLAILGLVSPLSAQHEHGSPESAVLGNVNFPTTCAPAVQADFNRAVALLHSFWYKKSEEAFAAIAAADPACGMADWGIAMSHFRQLWDPPTPGDVAIAWPAVLRAQSAGAKSQRELDYISAIAVLYTDSDKRPYPARVLDYEKSMRHIYEAYPEDHEGAIFYALAVRATAPIADKTYANQKAASAILERLFAQYPDHPGLAHYIIHCDDYPSLAPLALDAARRYARIAPDAPHALHMPSHIFTRLGLWQESIDSNLASAASARKNGLIGDQLHAMDYLVYAYLQTGQDEKALEVAKAMPKPEVNDAAYYTALYATGIVPARLAVERHRWSEAAALTLPSGVFPGGRYSSTEGDLYFAKALGAARLGNAAAARDALQQVTSLRERLVGGHDNYSAELVDIQRESVEAWLALAAGKSEDALRQMRHAADREDATEKLPVTPGAVVPARELLGEMLLENKQPAAALEAFETSLAVAPLRFNALAGAARAARASGDAAKSTKYYSALLANCPQSASARPELLEARAFAGKK
jgi:hypothetical protein